MTNHKPSQSGFAHIILVLLIVGVLVVAVGIAIKQRTGLGGDKLASWKAGCTSKDRATLTHAPMDLKDVATVTPVGLTAGAHVTPIDHLYFYPKAKERDAAPVYAMADGYIQEISSREVSVDSGKARPAEYRIVIQHSCQTFTYFDLITSLDPSIAKYAKGFHLGLHIPVKSGQVIGRIGGQSLDTAVYNLDLTLPGFIHPSMYAGEDWKIHTDQFFEYFTGTLKSQLLAMNSRKVPPYSGKIDYDLPGKLRGNWFLEGTNGYGGPKGGEGVGKDGHGYWDGHLAIFYDAIDGKTVTISVGRFGANGQPQAFAVKGNTPDPALVNAASGLVKYELIQKSQGINPNGEQPEQHEGMVSIEGVALFQVLPGEKLKVEIIPGKTAAEVSGFSSASKIYER